MTGSQILLALTPAAYVVGSIPFGLLVGLAKGIDVRKAGSGNIGATNVGRLLGKKYFWIVFTLDLLKGLIPSLAASWVNHFNAADWLTYLLWMMVGFAAIVGHMFSVFMKFKGGKGVSTSAGVLAGIWPFFTIPWALGMVVWMATYKIWGYISLASIVGSVSFPVIYIIIGLAEGWPIFGEQWPLLATAVLLAAMIVIKHRGNIARLIAGTENRDGKKPPRTQAPPV